MSRLIASLLVAVLVLVATPARGAGQSAIADGHDDRGLALMTPGARVRVKLPGERAWTATLVSLSGDSMLVRSSTADTTLVRISQVTQLEVSAGMRRSRHLVRNTAIWTGAGVGLGLLIGGSMTTGGCQKGDPCWENVCFFCDVFMSTPYPPIGDRAREGALIGGLAGGAMGLLVSLHRTHDWRRVSVAPRRTAVRLSARGAGMSIAF